MNVKNAVEATQMVTVKPTRNIVGHAAPEVILENRNCAG